MCVAFMALDAKREGYEVYPVVDAIAGTSDEAHRAGPERDWTRVETVSGVVEIVFTDRLSRA